MASEQELQRRRDEEMAARRKARRQAARDLGHPEWADMPANRNGARAQKAALYFTGRPCGEGHVAPRVTRTKACTACQEAKRQPSMRWSRPEWDVAAKFDRLATKMEQTGFLHYYDSRWHIRRTTEPISGDIRRACERAARYTEKRGVIHCVAVGSRGLVVRRIQA